jgi:hypothetical protein
MREETMKDDYDIFSANYSGLIPAAECARGEIHLLAARNVMRKITPRTGRLFIYNDGLIRVIQTGAHGYILAEDMSFCGSLIGLVPISDLQPVRRSDERQALKHIRAAEAARRAGDVQLRHRARPYQLVPISGSATLNHRADFDAA